MQKDHTGTKEMTGIKKVNWIQEEVVLDTIEIQEVQVLGLAEMIAVLDLIEVQKIIDVEKCTKQLAVTVEPDVTYHSSQNMTDQFIAENVFKITNHKNVVIQSLAEMIEVLDTIEIQEV